MIKYLQYSNTISTIIGSIFLLYVYTIIIEVEMGQLADFKPLTTYWIHLMVAKDTVLSVYSILHGQIQNLYIYSSLG